MTYEEFTLSYEEIILRKSRGTINSIDIVENNIYPGFFPSKLKMTDEEYQKYIASQDDNGRKYNDEKSIKLINKFYTDIIKIKDIVYCSYINFEIPFNPDIDSIKTRYNCELPEGTTENCDFLVKIGDDIEEYLQFIESLQNGNYKKIAYTLYSETEISKMILNSLKALLKHKNIDTIYKFAGKYEFADNALENELKNTAKKLFNTEDFEFLPLKFYKNQDSGSKELETSSQSEIMKYIVTEAEKAYRDEVHRDIFMTSPTGAGKSIIFQIPSIYLANKYGKLIIIIEPLKGLMDEQKSDLEKCGYKKVAFLNSDIPTPQEREKIINGVKNGEIDILYISPETLLSHSLDILIGDREVGLVVIDEAHIVTSWGVGFRPDYWYLGRYLNKFRRTQDNAGKHIKAHKFPIFACTATAVYGGKDDTVWETVDSLYMRDPIIKIGTAKRNNISFEINYKEKTSYDAKIASKNALLQDRIEKWISDKEKTIIYCPYKSIAHKMYDGNEEFINFRQFKDNVGIYTGDDSEYDIDKHEMVEDYKNGKINIMYATKAFGMGMDIKDIKNVYHYAATGNLNDYIQEIGRVARNKELVPNGTAIVDYYAEDFKYMNSLFGMSKIKQYQVKKCLSIIYDTYRNYGKPGFLVNPKMFAGAFGIGNEKNEQEFADNINRKIKIVLLMLEKDLREKNKTSVLKSTPNGLYTKSYVLIKNSFHNQIFGGKYKKYFKKIDEPVKVDIIPAKGDYGHGDVYSYSDGDTYEFDMKSMWEDFYCDEMSFAAFKYHYYNKTGKVLEDIYDALVPKIKLKVKPKSISFSYLFDKTTEELNYLINALSKFNSKYFSLEQFKYLIKERYKRETLCETIANNFIEIVNPNYSGIYKQREKYNVNTAIIRNLANKLIYNSSLMQRLKNCKDDEYSQFYLENERDNQLLKLLSILDLISYEMEGGNTPEIYIYLNAPDKIKRIVEDRIPYRNSYVLRASEKHYRAVKILDYFFKNLSSDEERWDFVEKYFLGEDVESDIIDSNELIRNEKIKNDPIENHINLDKAISLYDYENWDNIIENLFIESSNTIEKRGKYRYFCNLLKNNSKSIPDYAHTELEIKVKKNIFKIQTLFVYLNNSVVILPETYKEFEKRLCTECGWNVIIVDELENNLNLINDE